MGKPDWANSWDAAVARHGEAVSALAKEIQSARGDSDSRGIGRELREVARERGEGRRSHDRDEDGGRSVGHERGQGRGHDADRPGERRGHIDCVPDDEDDGGTGSDTDTGSGSDTDSGSGSDTDSGSGSDTDSGFADGVIAVLGADGVKTTFTTLADALANAEDGDTLEIGAGVYAETVEIDADLTIVGEAGAVIDGSATAGGATIVLHDGFSGGSIEGVQIVATSGGSAVATAEGEAVTDVSLSGNNFDAGANTDGVLVDLNLGGDNLTVSGNIFTGEALATSPMLEITADNVQVQGNGFGDTTGAYAKVVIFPGADGDTNDIALTGNAGLGTLDVVLG